MRNEFDLSYVAGFFDGEGSVCIAESHRKDRLVEYVLACGIGNTYFPILVFLKKRFGGTLHLNLSGQKRKEHYKPFLQWYLSGNKAIKFLKTILPYLIVKKSQAEVGIAFQEFKGAKRLIGKHDPDRFSRMKNFKEQLLAARNQSEDFQYTGSISRKDFQSALKESSTTNTRGFTQI